MEDLNKYIGIPWKLNGRNFKGIDCIGLVWLYFKELGIKIPDGDGQLIEKQSCRKDIVRLVKVLQTFTIKINRENIIPNDILLFILPKQDVMVGIYLGFDKFIHCDRNDGSIMSRFSKGWRTSLVGGYRIG